MANQPFLTVESDFLDIASELSLTNGESYLVQLYGGDRIEYLDFATDPTGANVSKNWIDVGDAFEFTADTAEPTWVRTTGRKAVLAVKDA